jgi:hypothetical protein
MTAVVEPTYGSSDSDLAAQVAKLWPHRDVKPTSSSDNSAASGCTGGIGWIYQNLFPAKTSTSASRAKR